jgi:copper homeostasis protein
MIRPRGGDFVFSQKELIVMKQDIRLLGELGADGFVFGILDEKGKVNQAACELLIQAAGDKPCTFHRAFDASSDLDDSLEKIIHLGFRRILTSGGKNSLTEGLTVVQELLQKAGDRIIIMPGGGSKAEHVPILKQTGLLKEIHSSCKISRPSSNQFINDGLSFSGAPLDFSSHLGVDPTLVNEYKEVL